MEAEVVLPVIERFTSQFGIENLEKRWRCNVEDLECRCICSFEESRPIEVRSDRLEVSHLHLVLALVRIAALHAREGRLSQSRLHAHNVLRLGSCFVRRVTKKFEDSLNVLQIAFPR